MKNQRKEHTKIEQVVNAKMSEGSLILINAITPYLKEGNAEKFVPIIKNSTIKLESAALDSFHKIMNEIYGWKQIQGVSGWRSKEEQQRIWNEIVISRGEEYANQYVALPGRSEHQSGLAIDVGLKRKNFLSKKQPFLYEGICKEFREVATTYGFVERYPKGKEHITGISHEPWHFRYVGAPHAKIMEANKLCLEEYIEFLKQYKHGNNPLIYEENGSRIAISYLEASNGKVTLFEIHDNVSYNISGNNRDGFIITQWLGKFSYRDRSQIAS